MIVIGLILAVLAFGFLVWLLFTLAVYALPCFVGMGVFLWAFHHGSGVWGAGIAGLCVGGVTLLLGRLAFAHLRNPLARLAVALLFALPASLAGFYAVLGVSRDLGAAPHWACLFAGVGALLVGGTAFARVAIIGAR